MQIRTVLLILSTILSISACGPSASAETLDPAAVVQGFYDAYNAGDQITISDLRVDGNTVTFNFEVVSAGQVSARGVDTVMRVEREKIVYFEIT